MTTNLAVGNTLLLSGDADYARHITDKRRLNSASTGGVLSGLKAGGESVLTGFASGIGGLISRPLDGMKENGAVGFMKGLGLGAVEAVFKPVVGLTDGVANIAHGISNELGQLHRAVPQVIRPQRALCRSPVDYDIRIVTPININACMAQELLKKLAQKEGRSDNYVASVVVQGRRKPGASTFSHENISVFERQDGQEHTAVLTEDIVFLMVTTRDRNIAEWVYAYKEISHCLLHVDLSTVEIVLYSRDATTVLSTNKTVSITCDTAQFAWELYCALYFMNFRMGNRSSMVPPEKLAIEAKLELTIGGDDNTGQGEDDEEDIEIAGENSHPMTKAHIINPNSVGSQDIRIGFSDYQFGTANLKTYPGTMLSEDQLLKKHIDLMSEAYWPDTDDNSSDHHTGMIPAAQLLRHMDECCWHFIYDWRSAHGPLNPGRCIAVLIINQSDHIVQITTLQLLEGRGMIVCPMGASSGYDADMRILQPRGGACTVFCYGYQYTFVNPAHVKLQINCSAFSGMFTTRMETKTTSNTSIGENGGHKVSFVEKSFTDWWGKYVVLIR